jgi:hypothetical protein
MSIIPPQKNKTKQKKKHSLVLYSFHFSGLHSAYERNEIFVFLSNLIFFGGCSFISLFLFHILHCLPYFVHLGIPSGVCVLLISIDYSYNHAFELFV